MRFLKLKCRNFKPYYDTPDKDQEIQLFDKKRKNRNITLNIGPTGHGKTSISEAILWCLYGEMYYAELGNWINSHAIRVEKAGKQKEIDVSVELTFEMDGDQYKLIRSGTYQMDEGEGEATDLTLLKGGEIVKGDPEAFVSIHFPRVSLMEYFVFDGDDILKKFLENRKETTKDHIDKIVGVERLNRTISALHRVAEIYEDKIRAIEDEISDETSENLRDQEKDATEKREAIKKTDKEMSSLKNERKKLFKGRLPSSVREFSKQVDKRDAVRKQIDQLNKEFKSHPMDFLPNMDLLLLDSVVRQALERLSRKETTKEEFEASVDIIRSVMGEEYCGVLFGNGDGANLIPEGARVPKKNLKNLGTLGLPHGKGTKAVATQAFKDVQSRIDDTKAEFLDIRRDFKRKEKLLVETEYRIEQMGETATNLKLKERYDQYIDIEGRLEELRELRSSIVEKLEKVEREITGLREELKYDEDQERKIEKIEERKTLTETLAEKARETRKRFLKSLLSFVNSESSRILRNVVKDRTRFHSIEIDSDYEFSVKQESGETLRDDQINRGNQQISLMSFFLGLAAYLEQDIPYVIDDPLLRLDWGHDRRLIKQLSDSSNQLILHMIPGKEYNSDSYRWLKPYINTQNWIHRKDYKNIGMVSFVERMDPDKMIEFEIEEL